MSFPIQKEVRDADSFLGAVFESIIEEVSEDIENIETGDTEIEDTTPPTMVGSIITWGDIHWEGGSLCSFQAQDWWSIT